MLPAFSLDFGPRLLAALGLTGRSVRRLDLRVAVNEAVTLDVEEFVARDSAEAMLGELERRRFVLIEEATLAKTWRAVAVEPPDAAGFVWVLDAARPDVGVELAYYTRGKFQAAESAGDTEDLAGITVDPTHWQWAAAPPWPFSRATGAPK